MKRAIIIFLVLAVALSGCRKGQDELQEAKDLADEVQIQFDAIEELQQQIDILT
ncbi:MAG: hypothetical protein FWD48_10565 [Oscillospiraceae bacterium]|nr:hypothetical protein [Oscillospiraceae bacterium]